MASTRASFAGDQPRGAREHPQLSAPFFELGPKNLLRLPEILEVAAAAQDAAKRHEVDVILTTPTSLIAQVRAGAPDLLVFAQSMDVDRMGPSVARVTAESLVDAGAHGVMLNHDANPLGPDDLRHAIARAHANDLLTMVCAGSQADVLRLLPLRPTAILFEPPELIGHTGGIERPWIRDIDNQVRAVAPEVLMMHAGGVGAPDDAYQIMRQGAAGTGSTSGVLGDGSPTRAVEQFISAARQGFDDHNREGRP